LAVAAAAAAGCFGRQYFFSCGYMRAARSTYASSDEI
jgi:hypothetical protein